MRFVTRKQEMVFNKLLELAGGDSRLVEKALRTYGSADETAQLSDVIKFILKHKTDSTNRNQNHVAVG